MSIKLQNLKSYIYTFFEVYNKTSKGFLIKTYAEPPK